MGLFSKLQNGDTVLKSLKFGKDRPGGGDSGQPYIKNPIIDEPGKLSHTGDDFLLRGGLKAPISAAEDVARLTKYMFDFKSPKGLLFIAKQNLLSRVSVATEASISTGYANNPSKDLAWTKAPLNQGIYTPLSTLLQAGVGFTGTHLNLLGINPFTPMAGVVQGGFLPGLGLIRYEDVVRGKTRLTKRVVIEKKTPTYEGVSYSKFDYNPNPKPTGYKTEKNPTRIPVGQYENRLLYLWEKDMIVTDNAGGTILTYSGGPGSILGIGKTKIKFADQRTGLNNPLSDTESTYFYRGGNRLHEYDSLLKYTGLLQASIAQKLTNDEIGIKDDGTLGNENSPRFYSPSTPNYTLSKSNPTGQPLTGSKGYQIGNNLKNQTQESDSTYQSPINGKLEEFGRQLLSPSKFINGQWIATSLSGDSISSPYSSYDTLATTGYLANLTPNSGIYEDPDNPGKYITQHNLRRVGGFGISADFRNVNRKKRGFYDPTTHYDRITSSSVDYSTAKTIDKIYYDSSSEERTSNAINSGYDLIKFRITVIDPRDPNNPTDPLKFRAYIDSFSDSYTADWKGQTYMGRAESFYKYNSFGRDMSLSFTIVADSEANLNIMYSQLNTLASSLAPTYTYFGYMAGNLHKLTVGNYVSNQVGIMSSLSYEITDESPWEIKKDYQLPFYIKVSTKFTPIHNFRPEMKWYNDLHQFIKQA